MALFIWGCRRINQNFILNSKLSFVYFSESTFKKDSWQLGTESTFRAYLQGCPWQWRTRSGVDFRVWNTLSGYGTVELGDHYAGPSNAPLQLLKCHTKRDFPQFHAFIDPSVDLFQPYHSWQYPTDSRNRTEWHFCEIWLSAYLLDCRAKDWAVDCATYRWSVAEHQYAAL